LRVGKGGEKKKKKVRTDRGGGEKKGEMGEMVYALSAIFFTRWEKRGEGGKKRRSMGGKKIERARESRLALP